MAVLSRRNNKKEGIKERGGKKERVGGKRNCHREQSQKLSGCNYMSVGI